MTRKSQGAMWLVVSTPRFRLLLAFALLSSATTGAAISKLCVEKISSIGPIFMQEHPAGGRAVIGTQAGLISLATLPAFGSKSTMTVGSTWLDLTSRVLFVNDERGLLSFAFHPKFLSNGRFFVSYICDANVHAGCRFACGCNTTTVCPVSSCESTTIIAEYNVTGDPRTAIRVEPKERIIYGFGRPFANHNGGHIFFGTDGFLYYTSGDGGSGGDPFRMAQKLSLPFGKILRFNVDKRSGSLNYAVPSSNPFSSQPAPANLVYALGLRNPWRCDIHPTKGTTVCGDVGQDLWEEVDVIRARGNYQWPYKEGLNDYYGVPKGTVLPGTAVKPILAYGRDTGGDCIIGGVFYLNSTNKCLNGKYIYADLEGPMWVADVAAKTTQSVTVLCSSTSAIACSSIGGGIVSLARDRRGHVYVLGYNGVFRIAKQSDCGLNC